MAKGESSAVVGVSGPSPCALRLCAYRLKLKLKLKCALSTRGAKCCPRCRRGRFEERLRETLPTWLWQICILCEVQQICVRSKNYHITRCPAVWLSLCLFLRLSLWLSLPQSLWLSDCPPLTHGHGTICEAFPSETHCKIYFRFIYARNARRNNHMRGIGMRRGRGSACACVPGCVCVPVRVWVSHLPPPANEAMRQTMNCASYCKKKRNMKNKSESRWAKGVQREEG